MCAKNREKESGTVKPSRNRLRQRYEGYHTKHSGTNLNERQDGGKIERDWREVEEQEEIQRGMMNNEMREERRAGRMPTKKKANAE